MGWRFNCLSREEVQPITAEPVYVTVPLSYRKDKRVAIGPLGKEEMVPISVLGERARQALVSRQTKQVFLRMDAGVNAQEFLNVMDMLKAGGVEAIGLVALDAPAQCGDLDGTQHSADRGYNNRRAR